MKLLKIFNRSETVGIDFNDKFQTIVHKFKMQKYR